MGSSGQLRYILQLAHAPCRVVATLDLASARIGFCIEAQVVIDVAERIRCAASTLRARRNPAHAVIDILRVADDRAGSGRKRLHLAEASHRVIRAAPFGLTS